MIANWIQSLTFHLEPLPGPDDLRLRVAADFSFEERVAALSEPRVPEDLLEDGRRRALNQRHCVRWNVTPCAEKEARWSVLYTQDH